jgi:hypothetical protein
LGVHVILPWLYVTALLGQSDLGLPAIIVTGAGLAGVALTLGAALLRPSWRLFWLVLPIVVTHLYIQIVAGWLIGDHHEAAAVSAYALALLAAMAGAGYAARVNPVAIAGATIFALAYAFIAYEASLFVFWTGLH